MMMVQEAAGAIKANWHGENAYFTGVSTDSRTVKKGDLFVALTGENFDGHDYIVGALEKGAVAAMTQKQKVTAQIPTIQVEDTRLGLGQLAAYWRGRFKIPLVAVTGSNGKTTVKEMIALILCESLKDALNGSECSTQVLATEGNLNNDIGVPQMLFRLSEQHRYAVIEMGMNHMGEIAYLTQLAKPTVAVVTNAGEAHIEGLGSIEQVARAKGEIFEGLDQQGVAIINADDTYAPLWEELVNNRCVVEFGLNKNAQIHADYQLDGLQTKMTVHFPNGSEPIILKVPGKHNVTNALAAAAVAVGLGINKQTIAAGLEKFAGVKGRLQKKKGKHDAVLIDDSYNANPASVRAALAVLAQAPGKKYLVLGDMGELGDGGADFHRMIGREARLAGISGLLTLGELSAHAATEYGEGARHFESMQALLAEIENLLAPDVTVLVKGSRFMRMENVIKQFET
ncbi:MAG: UDP-N-acetylmuramoyl-tripeptide--D-alanyl-D-alanine ligase [Nitrosomonas sp.]|nr:UDP-N-acetylmuramoyl-tripeptide--D-alanyl-D-alanine ligase [Nitrosomonas sp.]